MWVFYIPVPKGTGKALARKLVEAGACKCVNILESQSIYEWEGQIHEDDEEVLIVKTANPEKVKKLMKDHPYELPAILRVEVEANEEYEKWLKA